MDKRSPYFAPELWGGIECTINRVGNEFRDQLKQAGHYTRQGDLEQLASLGIKSVRYPVLWEHHQPQRNTVIDWRWSERQLNTIRNNHINPVVGLVHHGSGPAFTSLMDPDFPQALADYAFEVATRFPWIEYYTPVNEPLTTARFSGLYGLWYPHLKSDASFLYMLVNQVKAIILAMNAIKKVNPHAKLVQTEDLAKTHSTPLLKYQADFENERRWLSYDLLCGKVNQTHFLWKYLLDRGISQTDLDFFLENKYVPDIMGFNYYVTSERFIDHRIKNYPGLNPGGNGHHTYIDIEAVRVTDIMGLRGLLKEAWNRYQLPMAITEVHLGCTREDQMRWLKTSWEEVCQAKAEGLDIRAFTIWSLIGAYNWNSLLVNNDNIYENGAFEIRNNELAATALVKQIKSLAFQGSYDHPLLYDAGWWERDIRFFSKPLNPAGFLLQKAGNTPPVLIIGKSGTLGNAFTMVCGFRSIRHIGLSRQDINIFSEESIVNVINRYKPWAIINAAGYVKVDEAESERNDCFSINTYAPELMARICSQYGIQFMTFSSDLVFDGAKVAPYMESDTMGPLNVYGESKAEAERLISMVNPNSLIIRTSAFFGPWDKYNFVYYILREVSAGRTCQVVDDVMISPTYVPDLVNMSLNLLIDEASGIWHVCNDGKLTWADFAKEVTERAGYAVNKLHKKCIDDMHWKARRPAYSVLETNKGVKLPSFDNAINRYFKETLI